MSPKRFGIPFHIRIFFDFLGITKLDYWVLIGVECVVLCGDGVAVFVLVLWLASLNFFAGSHDFIPDFIPIHLWVFDVMRSAFSILADLHHLATILKIQCNAYKGFVKNKVARFQEFFF